MDYRIYRKNIPSQYIDLELTLHCQKEEAVEMQLPAWRPGRYELANYAQNIRFLKVYGSDGEISSAKVTKDRWTFIAPDAGFYRIQYQYHASQLDAGGSWSDETQLYINFINLVFEIKGREKESITVQMELPAHFKLATAMPSTEPFGLKAENFQHLVDSPLIASPTLQHNHYQVYSHTFHLWFQGEIHFDVQSLKENFIAFTKKQIDAFGEFPAEEYHFLFQLLPYPHYHGVEHQFSTVITLGPAQEFKNKAFMDRLMGVSSHELYHFWNVCRIRPNELLPYDFSKEAYIDTGVVAEGVTSYMGDLFLWKSGYFSLEEYLQVLEKLINREFQQFGWENQSIAESSLDLWLDGYRPGIPDRKVSIYNRGALISLCLDLMLLDHGTSLSSVMKKMWVEFGQAQIGYTLKDFQNLIAEGLKDMNTAETFFNHFIDGTEDLFPLLQSLLQSVGIEIKANNRSGLETDFGLVLDESYKVISIHPASHAYSKVMLGDVIIIKERKDQLLALEVQRNYSMLSIELPYDSDQYFKNYTLKQSHLNEKFNRWAE